MKILTLTTPTTFKVLNLRDTPTESDAFEYLVQYEDWIQVFLTKETKNADRNTI